MKKIDLIAPSFKISNQDLTETKKFFKKLDIKLVGSSKDLFGSHTICSASLDKRLVQIKKAFESNCKSTLEPSLKSKLKSERKSKNEVVWALRGGYGALHLVPHLKKIIPNTKKTFIGFSDNTVLHYYLNMHLNKGSVHGPHPNSFIKEHRKSILKKVLGFALNPEDQSPVFRGLKLIGSPSSSIKTKNKIETQIIGGNLTTLVSLVGGPIDMGVSGKILFLEEVQEPAYKVDRMLYQLKQTGFLKGVKAIVLGFFSHSRDQEKKKINQILKQFAAKQSYPVFIGMKAGHEPLQNFPFWLGKRSLIKREGRSFCLFNNI